MFRTEHITSEYYFFYTRDFCVLLFHLKNITGINTGLSHEVHLLNHAADYQALEFGFNSCSVLVSVLSCME